MAEADPLPDPAGLDPQRAYHVRAYVPGSEGDDLAHRITLLKARDCAAALRAKAISNTAINHACAAHEAAGAFVFADAAVPMLAIAASYCRHLVQAAMQADVLAGEVEA